jgi:hypothetical protein
MNDTCHHPEFWYIGSLKWGTPLIIGGKTGRYRWGKLQIIGGKTWSVQVGQAPNYWWENMVGTGGANRFLTL